MRPRRAAGATHRELPDGELVVLSADGERAVVLNPTGGVLWELAGGELELDELASLLCEAFVELDPARARADVERLVAELASHGLLEDARGR